MKIKNRSIHHDLNAFRNVSALQLIFHAIMIFLSCFWITTNIHSKEKLLINRRIQSDPSTKNRKFHYYPKITFRNIDPSNYRLWLNTLIQTLHIHQPLLKPNTNILALIQSNVVNECNCQIPRNSKKKQILIGLVESYVTSVSVSLGKKEQY